MSKVIEVEIEVGSKQALKSLNDLEKAQAALLEKLKDTKLGEKEYTRLQKQLKKVGSEIKDLELGFESLDKEQRAAALVDSFNGLAGAVTAVTGVFGLFGAESEQLGEVEKRVLNLIAVTSGLRDVSNGLVAANKLAGASFTNLGNTIASAFGVGEKATKGFKVALASVGIGVAIAAIALLIENFDELQAAITGTTEDQKELNKIYSQSATKITEQKVSIQGLVTQIKNQNLSDRERLAAYNQLATTIPGITQLTKLDTEAIEKATTAATAYIRVLQAKADAEIANQAVVFAQNKLLEIQNKGLEGQANSLEEVLGFLKDVFTFSSRNEIAQNRLAIQAEKYGAQVTAAYKLIAEATKKRDDALEKAVQLEQAYYKTQGLSVEGLTEATKTQKQLLEERLKGIEDATKRALAANELAARNDQIRLDAENATQEERLASETKYQKQAETIVQTGATRTQQLLKGINAQTLVDNNTTLEEAQRFLKDYYNNAEAAIQDSSTKVKEITQKSNAEL